VEFQMYEGDIMSAEVKGHQVKMAAKLEELQIVQSLKLRYLHFQSSACSKYSGG
jgi:hypothetical protein